MLIVELRGGSIPVREPDGPETVWYGGHANQLSRERIAYPRIDGVHVRRNSRAVYGAESPPPIRRPKAPVRSSCLPQPNRASPLARSPEAAFGAGLRGWNAVDVFGAVSGHSQCDGGAVLG